MGARPASRSARGTTLRSISRALAAFLVLSILPAVLVSAFLLPQWRLLILSLGMVFIFTVGTYAGRKARRISRVAPPKRVEFPSLKLSDPLYGPLERVERIARRLARIVGGSLATAFAAFVVIGTLLEPPPRDQIPYFVLNIGSVFVLIAAFTLLLDYVARTRVRRLAPIGMQAREAGLPFRGPSFVFEDGLFVSIWLLHAAVLTMFFAADGSVLHPQLKEALRWTGPRRLRVLKSVRGSPGRTVLGSELDSLQSRLATFFSVAWVQEPRSHDGGEEIGKPRWVVAVYFGGYSRDLVGRVAADLAAIEAFLRGFLRSYQATQIS